MDERIAQLKLEIVIMKQKSEKLNAMREEVSKLTDSIIKQFIALETKGYNLKEVADELNKQTDQ